LLDEATAPIWNIRRNQLVMALADMGQAEFLYERAKAVTEQFFKSPASVPTETLDLFLPLAAQRGDAGLWSRLVVHVLKAPRPTIRNILVRALGSFTDARLIQRSLDLVRDRQLRTQDFRTLVRALSPTARPVAWVWLTQHYAQIVKQLGPARAARLPSLASSFCSWQAHSAVKAFFEKQKELPIGTAQNLSLALEDIERCARQRQTIREPLRHYLALSR
jgi:aminopeptidase N/puromycin-sensitive aminopeptidase